MVIIACLVCNRDSRVSLRRDCVVFEEGVADRCRFVTFVSRILYLFVPETHFGICGGVDDCQGNLVLRSDVESARLLQVTADRVYGNPDFLDVNDCRDASSNIKRKNVKVYVRGHYDKRRRPTILVLHFDHLQ